MPHSVVDDLMDDELEEGEVTGGPSTAEQLLEQLRRRERELRAVHQITAALTSCLRLDDLVQETLVHAIEAVDASAGSVLLHDGESDRLVFRYVIGESPQIAKALTGQTMPCGLGLAGEVFRSGRGIISEDVDGDRRHYPEIDRTTHYRTRSMIIVPLRTADGRTLGVMEILNRRRGIFDAADLNVLEILATQAAAAMEMAQLHERVLAAEVEKERFCREVIRCVTHDKLHLVDIAQVPPLDESVLEVALADPEAYPALRRQLQNIAVTQGMEEDRAADLVLAMGEAATNAIKHAVGGRCAIGVTEDRVIVQVSDSGLGIKPENIPASLLLPGFSTKVSLGMGYTLMLELVDRIWLASEPTGTVVRLEKTVSAVPVKPPMAFDVDLADW